MWPESDVLVVRVQSSQSAVAAADDDPASGLMGLIAMLADSSIEGMLAAHAANDPTAGKPTGRPPSLMFNFDGLDMSNATAAAGGRSASGVRSDAPHPRVPQTMATPSENNDGFHRWSVCLTVFPSCTFPAYRAALRRLMPLAHTIVYDRCEENGVKADGLVVEQGAASVVSIKNEVAHTHNSQLHPPVASYLDERLGGDNHVNWHFDADHPDDWAHLQQHQQEQRMRRQNLHDCTVAADPTSGTTKMEDDECDDIDSVEADVTGHARAGDPQVVAPLSMILSRCGGGASY